jgi:hypothetical protein
MSTNTSSDTAAAGAVNTGAGVARAAAALKAAWAALTTGSRAIPFGDNGTLFRELAARIAASNRRT